MTTAVVRLPDELRQQIVDHCRAALPLEGCGLLALSGDLVTEVYPTSNEDNSAESYAIPSSEHYEALRSAEAEGWELGGVFHSHPTEEPVPSPEDVKAALEPEWVYLIVAMKGEPAIRAWRIRDDEAIEISMG